MRLSLQDRRHIDRIIRSRLAPYLRGMILKAPLALIVTLTINLTPDALAKVKSDSNFSVQTEVQSSENSESYDLDDLRKDNPTPPPSVGDRLGDQIVTILRTMGKSQSNLRGLRKQRASKQSVSDYMERHAYMVNAEKESKSEPDAISTHLNDEASNAVVETHVRNTELYKRLSSGFDFKLDIGKLFSSSKKKKKQPKRGTIKYGLILKDIKTDKNERGHQAAVGEFRGEDMKYAGEAKVEWTIGPIDESDSRSADARRQRQARLGTPEGQDSDIYLDDASHSPDANYDPVAAQEREQRRLELEEEDENRAFKGVEPSPAEEFWTSPKGGFKGNMKPTDRDALKSMSGGNGQMGMTLTLTQEQGIYELQARTPGGKTQEASQEHRFRIPIVGQFAVGRRYNDKMEVIQTSAYDVLVSKRAPSVSIHYHELREQYSAEASKKLDGYSLSAEVFSDANNTEKKRRKDLEHYRVGVKKRF